MQKALIVDDEGKARKAYRELLSGEGFEILEAENGEDAGLLLIQYSDIGLVLLDIRMPVVNGMVLFDLIRLNNPAAKIIVTSVYPLEDQKKVIDAADAYHDKAEGIGVLLAKIRKALPKSAASWTDEEAPFPGLKRVKK